MTMTIGFLQDGYNSQSTRFAMMDTDIQDLVGIIIITTIIVLVIIIVIIVNVQIVTKITLKVRTRKAELTIGPVVFKHFMLNNDGRSVIFSTSSPSPLSLSSLSPLSLSSLSSYYENYTMSSSPLLLQFGRLPF